MTAGLTRRRLATWGLGALICMALPMLQACRRGAAASSVPARPHEPSAMPRFEDITRAAGITCRHSKPVLDPALDNIMPWMSSVGAAVAAADFDRDGRIDLFVTSSREGEPNSLLRNEGGGRFTDVAAKAGLAYWNDDTGVAMDAVWGDVDDDGWPDLYLVRWGRDLLFRNQGDGTFADVTAERFRRVDGSPGTDWKNGNAAVFLDFNRDGRLDVYVGNFFADHDLRKLTTTRIMHDDFERARNGGVNQLFRQEADGTFTEVGRQAGVDDSGWTLAAGSADVNNDGWPDLYVANDFGADRLFLNRHDGTFENASAQALGPADTRKGMNVDFGDFDNDGWLDIYVTNITTAEYLQEGNMLWRNNGPGSDGRISFTDVAVESGTHDGGWGWGAKFFDADNDGDLDLTAATGFISAGTDSYWYDLASWTVTDRDVAEATEWPRIDDRSFSGYEPLRFWLNDGLGTFTERASEVGLQSVRDNRGIAVLDVDGDGRLDVFVANQGQEPHLFHNVSAVGNNWLRVVLEGDPATATTRDAVGARVAVLAGRTMQIRERDGGNGFAGQSDPRIHFGLGRHERVDVLEVRWPDGGVQSLDDVAVNQQIALRQDPARYAKRARIEPAHARAAASGARDAASTATEPPSAQSGRLDEMEAHLRRLPREHAPASAYRALASSLGEHDRAIELFRTLVAEHPDDLRLRIELGAALVDKIPTCGGVATVICKGTLARRSLDQLDVVVEAEPDSWVARYVRGMNHLHWPRALRHSAAAAEDLAHCVAIQERSAVAGSPSPPHYLRTHVALGDALARDGRIDEARTAWGRGLSRFPGDASLTERLAIPDGEILTYLEGQRSLERPIDTDLSFLDGP